MVYYVSREMQKKKKKYTISPTDIVAGHGIFERWEYIHCVPKCDIRQLLVGGLWTDITAHSCQINIHITNEAAFLPEEGIWTIHSIVCLE